MELSSFVRAFFSLCAVLAVAESFHIVYRILNHHEARELHSPLPFIRCGHDALDDVAPLIPGEIIAMADMVSANKTTIVDVYNIPDSQRGTADLEKCKWCAYHQIRCADDALYDGKYLCVRRTAENGFAKPGVCQKHIVNIEGYSQDEAKRLKLSKIEGARAGEDTNDVLNDVHPTVDVDFTLGDYHNRVQRSLNCPVPAPMKTANITCAIHPSHVKCHQRCFSGYTLEEGIETTFKCSRKDGVWRPREIRECERVQLTNHLQNKNHTK